MKFITSLIITILAWSGSCAQGSQAPNPGDPRPGAPITVGSDNLNLPLPSAFNQNGNSSPTLFNYKRIYNPLQPINNSAHLVNSTSTSVARQSTEYTDGWERVIQRIHYDANVVNKDLIECFDHRPSSTTYSFLPYSVNGGNTETKFQSSPYTAQKSYFATLYPDEEGSAVAKSTYSSNNARRVMASYQPGRSNIGNNKGTYQTSALAVAGEVLLFNEPTSSENPQKLGTYPAGMIIKKTVRNDDGALQVEYYDREGRIIATKQTTDTTWAGFDEVIVANPSKPYAPAPAVPTPVASSQFSWTYYIYDPFGKLRYRLSPKAVQKLEGANWIFSNQILNALCDYSEYDAKSRVTMHHNAGEDGHHYYVYDKYDRVVMRQNPEQQVQDKWNFTCYDKQDRVIMTGLKTSSGDREHWQFLADNANPSTSPGSVPGSSDFYYYIINEGTYYLPGFSTALSTAEILTITDYDDYYSSANNPLTKSAAGIIVPAQRAFKPSEFNGHLNTSGSHMVTPILSNKTKGLVTATKVKVLPPAYVQINNLPEWLETVHYYDEFNREIQSCQTNHLGGNTITSSQYYFSGPKIVEIISHTNAFCTNKSNGETQIVRNYNYDYDGDLLSVKESLDGGPMNAVANYEYDPLGRCIMKRIGSIETQDYEYNLRGQLTSINRPHVYDQTFRSTRKFGEILSYDSGLDEDQLHFLGKISGIAWRGRDSSWMKHYRYTYDVDGKLSHADYTEYSSPFIVFGTPSYSWNNNVNYSERDIEYDRNGNVTSLKRFGPTGLMDNLKYRYADDDNSNRLQYVDDLVTSTSPPPYDFVNVPDSNDFEFDLNGNLKEDKNKNLTITNNMYLNKPQYLNTVSGNTYYVYDALGNKLVEQYSGSSNDRVDYCNNFVYRNNKLQQVSHAEGYTHYNDTLFDKTYFFVRDHLGNVRQLLERVDVGGVPGWTGDIMRGEPIRMEPGTVEEDYVFATLINEVRDVKTGSLDPEDQWAAVLDANDPTKRIGVVMMANIMAGDRISLTADSYYEELAEPQSDVNAEDMLTSVLGALTGEGGFGGGEGGAPQILNQMFSDANYLTAYEDLRANATVAARPKSYLNYLFFDENMKLVSSHSGVIQIDRGDGNWIRDIGFGDNGVSYLDATYNGTLIVYLSSQDGAIKSSWDNTKMVVYRGEVREEFHYYPFGNVITTSTINTPKKWLYQGKELNKELYLFDFHARQYDPKLGRFASLDPARQYHSGFVGMADNPVSFVDPDGRSWAIAIPIILGAGFNIYSNWYNITGPQDFIMYGVIGGSSGYVMIENPGAGGSLMAGLNTTYTQFTKGYPLDMGSIVQSTVTGGVTAQLTANMPATDFFSKIPVPVGPVVTKTLDRMLNGLASGTIASGVTSAMMGNSPAQVMEDAMSGGIWGLGMGLILGPIQGFKEAKDKKVNPFSGKRIKVNIQPLEPTSYYRYMSGGEIDAIKFTGKLRGGEPGQNFFTKDFYEHAENAAEQLGLKDAPQYRVEFQIESAPKLQRVGTVVESITYPNGVQRPGGGLEWMTTDPVKVKIIKVEKMK